jgi:predicted nuclease with TOPRIM domain
VKKVNDEQAKCQRELISTKEANVAANEKLKEIELENTSAELELKALVGQKENLIVQHDELKLEVRRLIDARREHRLIMNVFRSSGLRES